MNKTKRQIDMRLVVTILGLILIPLCHGDQKEETEAYWSRFAADLWLEGADVVRIIWRDCSKKLVDVKDVIDHKEYFPKFLRCMKRKTLKALDRSLSPDIVPIADGVNLVRFELVDRSGNIMAENDTSTWTEKELDDGEWRTLALQRMAKVLRTHVIKFDFDNMKPVEKAEYRGRRRQHMMTMMMFGVVSIGMVLIPMGFQFLAVLGGKALLLAKMALILASIQGLKKIAASPVNYGFYHSYPPPYEHYEKRSHDDWQKRSHDDWQKRSHDNWPPPSTMPPTPPPTMSINSWPNIETGDIAVDRVHIATPVEQKSKRLYPVYNGVEDTPSFDVPTLSDLTTRPGEVQADFALDLPYNGFRFQTPTSVISA